MRPVGTETVLSSVGDIIHRVGFNNQFIYILKAPVNNYDFYYLS